MRNSENDIKFEAQHHGCIHIGKKIIPDKAVEKKKTVRPSREQGPEAQTRRWADNVGKQDTQTGTRPGQGAKQGRATAIVANPLFPNREPQQYTASRKDSFTSCLEKR